MRVRIAQQQQRWVEVRHACAARVRSSRRIGARSSHILGGERRTLCYAIGVRERAASKGMKASHQEPECDMI